MLRLNVGMFKADRIFEQVKHHLPMRSRRDAKVTFRRLIRKYLSYKHGGAIHPVTGRISKKIIIGKRWIHKGGRWRRKSTMLGAQNVGRPSGLATELLVSSLAVQWSVLTQQRTTISHKRYQHLPTKWECYLCDVLVRLGIFDCRRHAEKHSKSKGK